MLIKGHFRTNFPVSFAVSTKGTWNYVDIFLCIKCLRYFVYLTFLNLSVFFSSSVFPIHPNMTFWTSWVHDSPKDVLKLDWKSWNLYCTYRKVASSRPVYYSFLEFICQRSQYILRIKFPLHKPSESPWMCY